MQNGGRTSKSIKNIIFGLLNQIVIIMLGFVSRAVFLKYLNETYLGINSLFTEILSMLSLADLGMATVMVYSFFEPLAKNDERKIKALLSFYKKIYQIIAACIMVIGIAIMPFLQFIVNTEQKIDSLYLYYLLFLLRTVISYLFVYKVSILNADQKNYVVSNISSITKVMTTVVQVIILSVTKNYLLYLVIDIFTTWLNNFWCAKKADKLYTFSNKKAELSKLEKKDILQTIKSGFLYKFSTVLLNSTDNTIISTMLGTIVVGLYSNYGLVISKLSVFVNTAFAAVNGSIGNLIVTADKKRRYEIFSIMQIISFFVSSICVVCCYTLMDNFITLWIGERYVLGKDVLVACLLNFYLSVVLQPLWAYRDATGLFRKTKYIMLCTAAINLILSIALGKVYGLSGIIFASAISRLITYCWYEPVVLFKEYFDINVYSFFGSQIYNFIICCILCFAVEFIMKNWIIYSWVQLIIKTVIIFFSACVCITIAHFWRKSFKVTVKFVQNKF
ncbi:hypothetical protein [uncultured Clostridium sp.]|uniref:lipopolysaccharide biosynthesis protein n=1 Tax=uncultured Clostridium sp. TaxID=59620 RepID=UPI0025DF05F4|nr:hypothetical protein [uncultured Clostridium sp.]